MAFDAGETNEKFAEAGKVWNLSQLYTNLASVKQGRLTPKEKEYLRGLLVGLSPQEIAHALHNRVGGVRVALCSLYRHIEALVGLTEGAVNSRNAAYVLERAGYRVSTGGWESSGTAMTTTLEIDLIDRSIPDPPASPPLPVTKVRVLLSYCNPDCNQEMDRQLVDRELIEQIDAALQEAGHPVAYLQNCAEIDATLGNCDCLLLLLSPQAAFSEMVTEEVRRAREWFDTQPDRQPLILPVRVGFAANESLNHSLRWYLRGFQQWQWRSPADTPNLIQGILQRLATPTIPIVSGVDADAGLPPAMEYADSPPLPIAEPELPWGQIESNSAFYVERPPIETLSYETVLKPGALIRIKAPRQMGKTSLLARILYQAEQQNCIGISLTLQLADHKTFSDLDRFLQWFCVNVGSALQLENRLGEYWDDIFGSKINCTAYFERYLLNHLDRPLVLGLDEVDRIFQYQEIAEDFFGLLRAWHERAKNQAIWKKLRLIVVHSTEVYLPLDNHQSPFNVGLPIELPEFRPDQTWDLAERYGLRWSASDVEQLMTLIGGHPYLVRLALYNMTKRNLTLKQFLQDAVTVTGPYNDHLRRHLWNLEQHPELLAAVNQVATSTTPVRLESSQAFKLQSMGLVQLHGNAAIPRCELYRRYFSDRLP